MLCAMHTRFLFHLGLKCLKWEKQNEKLKRDEEKAERNVILWNDFCR